jgi:hypothetical protein
MSAAIPAANGADRIKALAKSLGVPTQELLALAPNNDPFFSGRPAQQAKAEWLARVWREHGFSFGVHLRRVHYVLVSMSDPPKLSDGTPYQNTERCWDYLGDSGKAARYLGLVSPDAFVDRRNPEPMVFFDAAEPRVPTWFFDGQGSFQLPWIQSTLTIVGPDIDLPGIEVDGYGYDYCPGDQPYHLEVWIEKSTMDDVLKPICQRHGVNLVRGVGFQSITGAIRLLQRVQRLRRFANERPCRIFYISDFDPAGDQMPVAVARQLEFWLPQYAPGADVKLTSLVLTREQVQQYRLPRIPIKDSDRRKAGFEERHGEGAVELDALEALHPGKLARVVREAIAPYRDEDLEERLQQAKGEAENVVEDAWQEALGGCPEEAQAIREEAVAIAAGYKERLQALEEQLRALGAELQAELAPQRERMRALRHAITTAMDGFAVELPERPEPEAEGGDESGWLFASGREYLEQMKHYKERKAAPEPEGGAA